MNAKENRVADGNATQRRVQVKRDTAETKISLSLNLDGTGDANAATGIGFFDHMLTLAARHGFFDLDLRAEGDLHVDCHHTVEDVGIVLGKAIAEALGKKEGIARYAHEILPMEDALVLCALDVSGRPCLVFEGTFATPRIGNMDTETIEEFFRAVCLHAGLNLHLRVLTGKNAHHVAEALFKAFGRALSGSTRIDPRVVGVLSTKGVL
ncbi:MAG: imidazoleglycerol-phosphate dehydratase HisB [Synergistaceae bacterium]|jgi:imidazoleglycerol-phosphate dehydratase|nr:imidazoleglycerol-phosphate dehydratase HisB [Synergistaceae bacterium]